MHDRVGRMADSWEYSHVAFPLERFSPDLLATLQRECAGSIEIEGDEVIIKHLYIERRMTPLNLYLNGADDAQTRHAIREYGDAIRELAAANIFPGDLLYKNFGVTRQGRVVFYDYDELCYLTECNFRAIPEAPYPEMEMSGETWYSVGPGRRLPGGVRDLPAHRSAHPQGLPRPPPDLLDPAWWRERQANIRAGYLEDVFPYPVERRFPQR